MRLIILLVLGFCLFSCNNTKLFQSREYNGRGHTFKFYPNNTYRYLVKMEGGYVYKYGLGTWKQEGRTIFLFDSVTDLKELSISLDKHSSTDIGINLIINILPKTNKHFDYLPQMTDLLNVELIIDNVSYPLINETSIIQLQELTDSVYFKVYPKANVESQTEILNDTLRSDYINVSAEEKNTVTIDLDCNPLYFARVKMETDTLKIISNGKIKWGKIYLHN